MLGRCDFCGQDGPLRKSHILPEFLYRPLYNSKGHMMGIHGQGRHGARTLQNGLKQNLFCPSCEGFFSTEYERPFSLLWAAPSNAPLPDPWHCLEARCQFDYAKFKLFHLLNLYRAGVSTLSSYKQVQLGPHLDNLRTMLKARDPGPAHVYQVAGTALYDPPSNRLARLVTTPQKRRYDMNVAWEWMYGGVDWMIATSGEFPPTTRRLALQADGSMRFNGLPWQHFSVMHKASAMLRGKE